MVYQEMLSKIINNEEEGLEILYNTYAKRLSRFGINSWDLSEDDALNATYNTLNIMVIKIFQIPFEGERHFQNYMYKVFVNEVRQIFRKKTRDEQNISFVYLEEYGDTFSDNSGQESYHPEYNSENKDCLQLKQLTVALEMLDPLEKDILLLKAQKYSYLEISEYLKIPNVNLKEKHYKAKQKLIKLINNNLKD
jgi:RNA polymerase sigma factor (sigma-70 family)